MIRKFYLVAGLPCLSLMVSSCDGRSQDVSDRLKPNTSAFQNDSKNVTRTSVGSVVPLDPCPGKDEPDFKRVIRVMIPNKLLEFGDRYVKYSNADAEPHGIAVEYNRSTVNRPFDTSIQADKSDKYGRNPLHIDLKNIFDETMATDPDGTHYYKIRVFIENKKKAKFFKAVDGAIGVERGTGPFKDVICQMAGGRDPNADPDRPIVTFYVRRGKSDPIPINLMVVGMDQQEGDETPIIIDPKIKNDG